LVHILHITRFAQWLQEEKCSIDFPFLLTMGGTDVHVDFAQSLIDETTLQLLEQATYITFFSEEAKEIVKKIKPTWVDKLKVVPQGVMLPPQVIEKEHAVVEKKQFYRILLPAGLRKVKDVLHLLEAWIELDTLIPNLKVTIVGEALEEQVYTDVLQACSMYSFLEYVKPVLFKEMGTLYTEADVVVNTSIEEGQPTAVCEAMALGIPVIVRHNPGNVSVVRHNDTGLVYKDPLQFVPLTQELRSHPSKRKQMVANAETFIRTERSVEKEIHAYLGLIELM
jgi:glycosyltransferase involved in cell wall biosynthesis